MNSDQFEAISERTRQIEAVGDLLARAHDCPAETAQNVDWLIRSLAEQIGERLGSGGYSAKAEI